MSQKDREGIPCPFRNPAGSKKGEAMDSPCGECGLDADRFTYDQCIVKAHAISHNPVGVLRPGPPCGATYKHKEPLWTLN